MPDFQCLLEAGSYSWRSASMGPLVTGLAGKARVRNENNYQDRRKNHQKHVELRCFAGGEVITILLFEGTVRPTRDCRLYPSGRACLSCRTGPCQVPSSHGHPWQAEVFPRRLAWPDLYPPWRRREAAPVSGASLFEAHPVSAPAARTGRRERPQRGAQTYRPGRTMFNPDEPRNNQLFWVGA